MSSDEEMLRERLCREKQKIIKNMVAQDSAYWDVKEKLRQTESSHEKLQQKMVDLQTQYETVSGKYQDELRFRSETLNKLDGTREICDVVQDSSECLRATLSRCMADRASLCEAYQRSGQVVRDLKDKQINFDENSRLVIDNLQGKIRLTTEYNAQEIQSFASEKQRMESELEETKTKLSEAGNLKEELLSAGRELNRELDACREGVQKNEECINALQKDMNYKEFNAEVAARNNTILKQKEENKELTSKKEALQQALTNQESVTNSVVTQNNGLQEKLADLENEISKKDGCIAEMQETIQNAKVTNESLTMKITNMHQEKQDLLREIEQKNEILIHMELELLNHTRHMSSLDRQKCVAEAVVSRKVDLVEALKSRCQQITAVKQDLEWKFQELDKNMEAVRAERVKKVKQLRTALEEKERDLAVKAGIISKLMGDVKHGLDVQTEVDATLQRVKSDMESERQRMGQRESELVAKIGQLQVVTKDKEDELRSKDEELDKQITVIRDLRGDKERLNRKIVEMQMPRLPAPPHPHPSKMSQQSMRLGPVFVAPASAAPSSQQRNDHLTNPFKIFDFLSDDSMDDSSNPVAVNPRFQAISRGEHDPSVHRSPPKKRRSTGRAVRAGRAGTPQPH